MGFRRELSDDFFYWGETALNQDLLNMWFEWNESGNNSSFFNYYFLQKEKLKLTKVNGDEYYFDMKLDHWNIYRLKGESYKAYSERILKSQIWNNTKDISSWDLSHEGASRLNNQGKASKDIYYFSLATEESINISKDS